MTSTSGMTFEEMSESLTGYDEIAVSKHMGMDVYTDGESKPVLLVRSLVFVHLRRQGNPDPDARDQAMSMTLKDCNGYFESDDTELDPEEPVTEPGKDVSPPVSELAS